MDKTYLVIGLIALALLIIIGTLGLVHYAETKKIRERLGQAGAHPNTLALMEHLSQEHEATRSHISNQMATKDHDGKTAQGLGYEILAKLNELIKVITTFIRGIK